MKLSTPLLITLPTLVITLSFMLVLTAFPQVPASPRSKEAIRKYDVVLQKQFSGKGLHYGNPVFIRIFKETNELEIWVKEQKSFKLFKRYSICYYSGGLGTKTRQNDGKSPEGFYQVFPAQMNPGSDYWLSFNIGYPNAYERSMGYTGGAIMVHGDCVSIGCYAMGNEAIEEIWTLMAKAFSSGQSCIQVHIFPFRMTTENMEKHSDRKWQDFWKNLKEGYDYFESRLQVPDVGVMNGRYVFGGS